MELMGSNCYIGFRKTDILFSLLFYLISGFLLHKQELTTILIAPTYQHNEQAQTGPYLVSLVEQPIFILTIAKPMNINSATASLGQYKPI